MRAVRRFRLSARGRTLLIFGLGIGFAAYPTGRVELLYLGVFLACSPLLALAFVRFRTQRFAVSRTFTPDTAEAGRALAVNLEVRNLAGSRTLEARWRDLLPWPPHATAASALPGLAKFRGALGRGNSVDLSYLVEPPRRGITVIGPLVVDFADPFSLASGEISVGGQQEIVVAPAINLFPVTGLSMTADEGSARTRQRRSSGAADELMTREYRYGDPMRRVHWRSSAHHGELMVRQDEQRSHAEAHIVLDTRRAGYRDADAATALTPESPTFEWALAFAASLALHLHRSGYAVELAETGYQQLVPPGNRQEFLRALATVQLVAGAAHWHGSSTARPGLGTSGGSGGSRGSLGSVFAVLADADEATRDQLCSERAYYGAATAFVVNQRSPALVEQLSGAGWNCISVTSADDPAEVWRSATEPREVHYGRA